MARFDIAWGAKLGPGGSHLAEKVFSTKPVFCCIRAAFLEVGSGTWRGPCQVSIGSLVFCGFVSRRVALGGWWFHEYEPCGCLVLADLRVARIGWALDIQVVPS